jgi:hypothetical protein
VCAGEKKKKTENERVRGRATVIWREF